MNFKTFMTFNMLKALHKYFLSFLFCCFSYLSFASDINKLPTNTQYGFIENKGQFVNQFYEANNELKFLLYNKNFNVHLKNNGFSYELYNREIVGYKEKENSSLILQRLHSDTLEYKYNFHRLDFEFINFNNNFIIETYDVNNDFINYYYEWCSNGILNVRHYQKIVYKNFYPNIDLEFLVNSNDEKNSKFKYNFIIHPSGNYNDIQFKINGSFKAFINQSGEIEITTSIGKIIEKIPLTYQTNKNSFSAINSSFCFNKIKNTFGFKLDAYNQSNTLVIDPMPWSTYYGGNQGLGATAFYAVDFRNEFIAGAGYTNSLNAIATTGAFQTSYAGGNNGSDESDALLVIFNSNCERQWATYYGGTLNEHGRGVRFDKAGNVIMAGYTFSLGVIASSGSFQPTLGGGSDLFLVKFNSFGQRIWGTYFGGAANEVINSSSILAIDSNNHYVLTGASASAGLGTSGVHQTLHSGSADAIIAKFDSNGTRLWCTYFGGTGIDISHAVALDTLGNIHIAGETTSSSGIATLGAHQQAYGGNYDGFVAKFNSSGSRIWSTYIGGSGLEASAGIACDIHSNIAITGSTSSLGMATQNAHQTAYGGIYISKFNKDGNIVWCTYYGVSFANDGGGSIIFDNDSNIIASGSTRSASNIASPGAFQTQLISQPGSAWNAYITKFGPSGIRQWGTYFGGSSGATLYSLVCNPQNNIIAGGFSGSITHVATNNSFLNSRTGLGILAVFTPNGDLVQVRNNNLTGSQTICARSAPDTIIGALPLGVMVGNFSYLWLSSNTDSVSGFAIAMGNSTFQHYKPGNLTQTTWYRRVVISANKADTSHAIQITVLSKPQAGFSINNPGQCLAGNSFVFTDTSVFSGTYQRLWHLGNGINDTSTLAVVLRNYQTIGNYLIKLLLINPDGCNDSIIHMVSIGNKPQAAFTVNNNQQCQNNNTFVFANQSTVSSGPLQYYWQFSPQINDTSTLPSPNKTYMQQGNYSVQLIANSWGCTDTSFANIAVLPKPIAGFSQNSLTQCFKNNRFEFADTSIANGAGLLTRHWRFSSKPNDTSILQNPIKQYDTIGVYQVRLIVIPSNGCSDTLVKTVQTLVTPTPSVWTNTNTTQLLTGNFFRFGVCCLHIQSYSWDLGDLLWGQTWNDEITRTYTSPAAYTVKLFTSNNNGCSDTAFLNIKILPNAPTQQASSLLFSNTTNASTRVNWSNGNGTQRMVIARPGAAVNINPQNGMGYIANSVYGQGANLGGGNFVVYRGTNNFVNVTGLNPLTQYHFAVFEFNGDSILSSYRLPGLHGNQATLPVTWLDFIAKLTENNSVKLHWQTASEINNKGFYVERSFNETDFEQIGFVKGNGNTSTISNYNFTDQLQTKNFEHRTSNFEPNIVYYRLKQTDFDGVYDYSKTISVNTQQANDALTWLSVFPNPASNEITIESNNDAIENITFYNTQGIICKQIHADNKLVTIQIEDLKPGLYQVWVQTKMANKCIKVVVK